MLKKEPHQGYTEFFIFAEKEIGLLQAFKELTRKISASNLSLTTALLSKISQATDVKSYFDAWGWDSQTDSLGNIIDIAQRSPDIQSAMYLFQAISPWVAPGSFITLYADEVVPYDRKLCFEDTGLILRRAPASRKEDSGIPALVEQALELVNKAAAIAANNRGSMAAPSSLEAALETARAGLVEASRFDVT